MKKGVICCGLLTLNSTFHALNGAAYPYKLSRLISLQYTQFELLYTFLLITVIPN